MLLRHIHGVNKGIGQGLGKDRGDFVAVDVIGKQQPLDKGHHARGKVHKIDRCPHNQGIRFLNPLDNGRQIIPHGAGAMLLVLALAVKATDAAFEIQAVETHQLCFRSCFLCAFQRLLQKFCGVAVAPGTAIDGNYFFHPEYLLIIHNLSSQEILYSM